jgi:hypothetical protein
MERLIHKESGISLQIVECGAAGPKSENGKLATFLPIAVIGKVAKLKCDEEGVLAWDRIGYRMHRMVCAYFREANDALAQCVRHKRSKTFAVKAVCQTPSIRASL